MFQEMLQFLVNIVIFSSMIGRTRLGTETKEYFKTAFYSQIVSVLLENEFLKKPISSIIEEKLKDVAEEIEKLKKEVKSLKDILENSKENKDKESKLTMEKSGVNINFSLENYSRNNEVLSVCQVGKNNSEEGVVVKTQDFLETSSVEFLSLKSPEPKNQLEIIENLVPNKLDDDTDHKNICGNNSNSFGKEMQILENNKQRLSHKRLFGRSIDLPKLVHPTKISNETMPKSKSTTPFIRGTNDKNTGTFTAPFARKSIFFAKYFSLGTTKNQLETYLKDILGTNVFCEEILPNKKRIPRTQQKIYLSFKIVVDCNFRDALYNSAVWPEGIVVKNFRKFVG